MQKKKHKNLLQIKAFWAQSVINFSCHLLSFEVSLYHAIQVYFDDWRFVSRVI